MGSFNESSAVILGGGRHAAVLLDALQSTGSALPRGILDANPARWGTQLLGVPVLGGDELLEQLVRQGVRQFAVGVGSTGSTRARCELYQQALSLQLTPLSVRHATSVCSPHAEFGPGVQLLAGSIVGCFAQLGANVVVNTGAVVEHDCVLGEHVFVASGAVLGGAVQVGRGAHIGAGATVLQGIRIAPGAIVGAGAVVVRDVEESMVVAGVPARVLRRAA